MKETAVAIRQDGQRVWPEKCVTDPGAISALIRKRALGAKRVVFETGPLAVWLFHALHTMGIPVICIDARHAKAALNMTRNKTDANNSDGLAHLAEVGFDRAVRVKGFESMLTRTLIGARRQLTRMTTQLSNQIRGVMKTFGLIVPAGKGSKFNQNVRNLLANRADLAAIVLPLLEAWQSLRERVVQLGTKLHRPHANGRIVVSLCRSRGSA